MRSETEKSAIEFKGGREHFWWKSVLREDRIAAVVFCELLRKRGIFG